MCTSFYHPPGFYAKKRKKEEQREMSGKKAKKRKLSEKGGTDGSPDRDGHSTVHRQPIHRKKQKCHLNNLTQSDHSGVVHHLAAGSLFQRLNVFQVNLLSFNI